MVSVGAVRRQRHTRGTHIVPAIWQQLLCDAVVEGRRRQIAPRTTQRAGGEGARGGQEERKDKKLHLHNNQMAARIDLGEVPLVSRRRGSPNLVGPNSTPLS